MGGRTVTWLPSAIGQLQESAQGDRQAIGYRCSPNKILESGSQAGLVDIVEKRGSWASSKPALQQCLRVAVNVTVSHIPEVTQKQGTGKKTKKNKGL